MKPKAVVKNRLSSTSRNKGVRSPAKDKPRPRRAPSRPPRTVVEALNEDLAWVRQNIDELIQERGRVYLAVRHHEVFDADRDRGTLVMRLFREHPREGFLVVSLEDPRLRGEEEPPDFVPGVIDEDDME